MAALPTEHRDELAILVVSRRGATAELNVGAAGAGSPR
jgi:hypothetical protein